MLQVIINLVTLNALNSALEVYAGLGVVWLLMLVAGCASVLSRPWHPVGKMAWCLVLIALPVAGMTLYCLVSLFLADYAFLKVLGLGRKHGGYMSAERPAGKRLEGPVKSQP